MKEGWTYKTIEDACSINYGTRVVQKKDKGSTYYVYGGGGATFMIDRYNREDCFIVSRFAMSPKCTRYVEGKFFLNDSGLSVSTNDEGFLCQKFLDKVLLANNDNIYAMGKGMAQRNLDMPSFRKLIIPVPPIAEQERIVAELDLLSGIIEKKKEQLKAYDQLAQSIFYTMFGDPIDNPKGWEVKNMGDIGDLQRGSGLSKKDLTENGFPCILYGQIHTRFGAFTRKHIACIPQELVSTAKIAHFGDIVMAITSEDVEGSCKSVAWMGDYDIAVGSDAAIYRHTLNPIYVSYYTQTKAFYFEKAKYAKGFKVTHISTKEIAKIPIPVPPLSLQQEFAEKVEAIERQKALVQQSIEETQTMFDYTMDKYFG